MKILLSIKPEYASRIFEGVKRFEYRRVIPARAEVRHVVVYASRPVGRVIGEFEIGGVLSGTPVDVWRRTQSQAGISRHEFFEYFRNARTAHAIQVMNEVCYEVPLGLAERFRVSAPQSFRYLDE
ncbi:MAG: ASCH domain-containing protein [Phycisphaerales bacterium]